MIKLKKMVNTYLKNADNRRLLINVAGNYLVKGGAMLVSLLVMPAYMRYFQSQAVLGMWFTVVQLLNWIMLLDFGIGGGLRNKIVEPLQKGNKDRVIELTSAAYISVAGIVLVLIVLQHFVVDALNWYTILGLPQSEISESTLKKMVHILVIGVCIRFFSVLICHVLYALQKAVLPGFINLISSALIMLYLLFAKPTNSETDIVVLAYVNSIANNLPALIATVWVFATVLKGMWPRISAFTKNAASEVLGTGGMLFYLQIIIMVLFNVKELYISWFVGSEAVVEYQIYYKLIGMIGGLFSLALSPVWSAVTKALVEKKEEWIRSLYRKGMELSAIFGIAQIILVVAMPMIVKIWLGESAIAVSRVYAILFCIYNLIYMWMMLNYNFACGMGRTRVISIWLTIAGIGNLLLTMWGCGVYKSWITVVVATAIASIPCAVVVQNDIFKVIKNMNDKKEI